MVGEDTITCDNVVVATGTFGRKPYVPAFAADLDPSIQQLHSCEYKRPSQISSGPVLVVGASHSGCDIAFELAQHLPTTLVGRDCGQIPFHWDRRPIRFGFPAIVFVWQHVLTRRTPMGRKELDEVRHHGGPMLRVKREHLQARGVERITGRVAGVKDGLPVLDDGRVIRHRRSSGAPASSRISTGSRSRPSVRTDGPRSTAVSSSRLPDCSSAASLSSSPSAPWCCWAWGATRSTSRDRIAARARAPRAADLTAAAGTS